MRVLITGGAGYIGSHAAKRLLARGDEVVIVDDLSRGHAGAVRVLEALAPGRVRFEQADVRDGPRVARIFRETRPGAVLHFAALAYVRESVDRPLDYFDVNVGGTVAVLRAAIEARTERFVLSSSCAVYGSPGEAQVPIDEACPAAPINPYGATKAFAERALRDAAESAVRQGAPMRWAALRYFNVTGADPDGALGEDHRPETHLIPGALQCAMGLRPYVEVLGDDFPTADGSCVRDFIHVEDLVAAHLLALDALGASASVKQSTGLVYNVGAGGGTSVLEAVRAVERVTGRRVPVVVRPRHPADPPVLVACAERLRRELGWAPRYPRIESMVEHAWRWMREHPEGYVD